MKAYPKPYVLGIIGCHIHDLKFILLNRYKNYCKITLQEQIEATLTVNGFIDYALITLDREIGPWIANVLTNYKIPYIVVENSEYKANNNIAKLNYWKKKALNVINIRKDNEFKWDFIQFIEQGYLSNKIKIPLSKSQLQILSRNIYALKESTHSILFYEKYSNLNFLANRLFNEEYDVQRVKLDKKYFRKTPKPKTNIVYPGQVTTIGSYIPFGGAENIIDIVIKADNKEIGKVKDFNFEKPTVYSPVYSIYKTMKD